METAHNIDACTEEKFWWRRHMTPPTADDCVADCGASKCKIHGDHDGCELMTIAQVNDPPTHESEI